ncbi:MAG: ATP-binding protein [Spirochaetes bacterium RBG_13_68_11]|nr:MAG: ATP-binding protein [Spirochaetes bacterium RBG_13_68_11]
MERVLMSWSGGKDSALALAEILNSGRYEIAALLTTVTRDYDRISMHGVRRSLLKLQADSLGLRLEEVFIAKNASNVEYESSMRNILSKYKETGINAVVIGDIFLEDVRKYREQKLSLLDMRGIFPIWKIETRELVGRFIRTGFKAITTCVDTKVLGKEFAGRELNNAFLSELPDGVDPCGENGEYHSFVYDGPIFNRRIEITIGEKVLRENRYFFCDLVEREKSA